MRKIGPHGKAERRGWLKMEYGLGTNAAWWIAERAAEQPRRIDDDDPESYLKAAPIDVERMYRGEEPLKPIHDALIELGRLPGKDVKFCPCETIVPLFRDHVLAQIRPSTNTRIDFGLALKGTPGIGVPGTAILLSLLMVSALHGAATKRAINIGPLTQIQGNVEPDGSPPVPKWIGINRLGHVAYSTAPPDHADSRANPWVFSPALRCEQPVGRQRARRRVFRRVQKWHFVLRPA